VLDRLSKVKNRRFRTGGCSGGLQRVFDLVKERLNRGYSGGLRGCSALQRSDFDSCSVGLRGCSALQRSDFDGCSGGSQGIRRRSGLEGIALGDEKRLRLRMRLR